MGTNRRTQSRMARPSQGKKSRAPPTSSSAEFAGNSAVPASDSKARNNSRRGRKKKEVDIEVDPHEVVWAQMMEAENEEDRFALLKGAIPEGNSDITHHHLALIKDYKDVFASSGAHSSDSRLGKGKWCDVKVTIRSSSGAGVETEHDYFAQVTHPDGRVETIDAKRVCALIADSGTIRDVKLPLGGRVLLQYSAEGLNKLPCSSPMLAEPIAAHAGQGEQTVIGSTSEWESSFASPDAATEAIDLQGAAGAMDLLKDVIDGYLEEGDAIPSTPEEIDAINPTQLVTIRATKGHILNHPLVHELAGVVLREGDLAKQDGDESDALLNEARAAMASQAQVKFTGPKSMTADRYTVYQLAHQREKARAHAGNAMDPNTLTHTVVNAPLKRARVGSSSPVLTKYNIAVDFNGKGFVLDNAPDMP